MKIFKSRKFRQGAAATLIIVIGIVIIIFLNMIAGTLTKRFGLRGDMSDNNIFTLSQESVDFLAGVDKEVDIYVLSSEEYYSSIDNLYYKQALEMMRSYSRQNNNIKLSFVDIIKNPGFAASYPDLALKPNDILIQCGENAIVLAETDIFNVNVDRENNKVYITASKAEQALSSAILNVSSDEKTYVSVISGHNETAISDFEALLQTNNYEIRSQNLMTEDINPGTDIVIIAAPARDFSEEEAKKLDRFLNNDGSYGKTLLFLADIGNFSENPVLSAFLAEWGIGFTNNVVYETEPSYLFQSNVYATLCGYSEEEYSKSVTAKSLPFAMPQGRGMELLFTAKDGVQAKTIMEYTKSSGIMSIEDAFAQSSNYKASGPHPAMILSQKITYKGIEPLVSNLVCAASITSLDAYLLGNENFANSEYMLNLLGELSGKRTFVSIQNKTVGSGQLGITMGTALFIMVITLVILPAAVLISGIVVWLRRRHR